MSFAETFAHANDASQLVSVSDGRYKLVRALNGRLQLFDLEVDPHEERSAAGQNPEVVAQLGEALDQYLALAGEGTSPANPLDPAAELRLRALGYID